MNTARCCSFVILFLPFDFSLFFFILIPIVVSSKVLIILQNKSQLIWDRFPVGIIISDNDLFHNAFKYNPIEFIQRILGLKYKSLFYSPKKFILALLPSLYL